MKCVVLLLWCACIVATARVNQNVNSECQTPTNELGTCLLMSQCPELQARWVRRHSLPKANKKFLLDSQCGSQGRKPLLCCKVEVATNLVQPEEKVTTTLPLPDLGSRIEESSVPNITGHINFGLINPEFCGMSSGGIRIINGKKAALSEYPWMALLEYNTTKGVTFGCGGTLINERYILTAAHCITKTNTSRQLVRGRVGEHDHSTEEDCEDEGIARFCAPPYQSIEIEKTIQHPGYNRRTVVNDIGLLRLARPVDLLQDNVQPICLPVGEELNRNLDELKVIVAGWGVTEKGRLSTELMKVTLPVVPNEQCNTVFSTRYNKTISSDQICAGGSNLTQDSCSGDSGGPLKSYGFHNTLPSMIQYGIVSFGDKYCGLRGDPVPGVYTRVSNYMDWILDNIEP